MNRDGAPELGIIVDPSAPRCPDCNSADVGPWRPPRAPLSRMAPFWMSAVTWAAVAAWFWMHTRTVMPKTMAHPDPVDHRQMGDVVVASAIIIVGWCAGMTALSRRRPTRATHVCLSCGNTFSIEN